MSNVHALAGTMSKSNFRAKFTHALLLQLHHLPNSLSYKFVFLLLHLRENIDRLENKQI